MLYNFFKNIQRLLSRVHFLYIYKTVHILCKCESVSVHKIKVKVYVRSRDAFIVIRNS